MTDDLDPREAADAVFASLLTRIGEEAPEPRLDATRRAVELLGDPHRAAPVIHITGTNGKTSTSRMIESLLRASGLRTGLLTSPHLARFTERIRIDGEPVDDDTVARTWEEIGLVLAMVDAELAAAGEATLTFFESLTVLAFACFADAPVDVVVLEVGLGGEWDSTNVADGQVAVFTPIALDHENRLGRSVAEIARTKAGIVKPAASVVSALQSPEALAEIEAAAARNDAGIALEGRDFAVADARVAVGGQLVSIRGLAGEYTDVALPLLGRHQAENAAVAIAAVETFLGGGSVRLADDLVEEGLGRASSPGRLHAIAHDPTVLVDAAHNPHGADALMHALFEFFDFDEVRFVIGVLSDKDAAGIVRSLAAGGESFIVTEPPGERALAADDLAAVVADVAGSSRVEVASDLASAIGSARAWASAGAKRGVVVTGSILLVGTAMAIAADRGWSVE